MNLFWNHFQRAENVFWIILKDITIKGLSNTKLEVASSQSWVQTVQCNSFNQSNHPQKLWLLKWIRQKLFTKTIIQQRCFIDIHYRTFCWLIKVFNVWQFESYYFKQFQEKKLQRDVLHSRSSVPGSELIKCSWVQLFKWLPSHLGEYHILDFFKVAASKKFSELVPHNTQSFLMLGIALERYILVCHAALAKQHYKGDTFCRFFLRKINFWIW